MRYARGLLIVGVLLGGIGLGRNRWGARAQEGPAPPTAARPPVAAKPIAAEVTVEEALLRRTALPFAKPTTLADVAEYLHQYLHAPVVLDKAALDRLDRTPDDTVALQLDGVRLKTSLQLLLDQVGMTFRVVPEDNLLILTDRSGSTDRLDQALSELRSLRTDVRDLEEMVDSLLQVIVPEDSGAEIRKPTIIDEPPGGEKPKSETSPVRTRAG
jgi:hypothetical protein